MYNNSTNMFSINVPSLTQRTVFHSAGASTLQLKEFSMTTEVCEASNVYAIYPMNK